MNDFEKLKNVFDFNFLDKYQLEALEELVSKLEVVKRKNQALLEKVQEYEQQTEDSAVLSNNDFHREVVRMLAYDERYGGISSIVYLYFSGLEELSATKETVYRDFVRVISDTLVSNVRKSDIVGKVAKSEFGILLLRCGKEMAWAKAKSLTTILKQDFYELNMAYEANVKVSCGAYTYGEKEDAREGLQKAAKVLTFWD